MSSTTAAQEVTTSNGLGSREISEKDFEAHIRTKVLALHAEHGDAYVQKELQNEIGKVKKKETELANMKKKIGVMSREVDDVQDSINKTAELKRKAESMCHVLQQATKKRELLTAKMTDEMAEQREDVRRRVEANVQEIRDKCDKRQAEVDRLNAENETLAAQVGEKKAAFEDAYHKLQKELSGEGDNYRELRDECQSAAKEVELLDAKLLLVRRERNMLESSRVMLAEQLKVYEGQFEGFANTTMKPVEVERLAEQQKAQGEKRIGELEKEKAEATQLRIQFDKDLAELRVKAASLKKELQLVEKQKKTVEKKCRQAQLNIRDKKK